MTTRAQIPLPAASPLLKALRERIEKKAKEAAGKSSSIDLPMKGKTLLTWGREGETFCYEGSVKAGTTIHYGDGFRRPVTIDASDYQKLLNKFSGREVPVGTSKDSPPPGSVGEWMKANVNKSGLMSYVGAILIEEGYATKPRRGRIRFK